MNGRVARAAALGLWLMGLSTIARRVLAARGRFVIELHGVPRRRYSELPISKQPSLIQPDLERILNWLSNRFRILTPGEFFCSDVPGVLLTFDDGFANNFDVVLPLLKEHRAPAVFFVATGHLGGDRCWLRSSVDTATLGWGKVEAVPHETAADLFTGLNQAQIGACLESGLVTIGAHSASHRRLTTLSDDEARSEVEESRARLEQITRQTVDLFAYPFGDANQAVARIVQDAGFRAAFVEESRPLLPPRLAIPRVGIYQPNPWYLSAKLSGLWERPLVVGYLDR